MVNDSALNGNNKTDTGQIEKNSNKRFHVDPVVSCRIEGDDGALLFNPDTNSSTLINPTGLFLWKYLSEPRTVEEITRYIMENFNECPDYTRIREDVIRFLSSLTSDYIKEEECGA